MIKLNDLSRVFHTQNVETRALNNINITVKEGEFVTIMGPSGCGKSTLLSLIGMLDSPSSGDYIFNQQNISNFGERKLAKLRRESIGFVFQSFNLIDDLTVFENVALPLQYLNVSKKQRTTKVEAILKQVGIDHRSDHLPQQLSGGQQQRVAVARALVISPKLILADEPTGNLDSKNGEEVMAMLRELHLNGTTIIMVTHSDTDAKYASRIIQLFDGQIMLDKASEVAKEVSYA
jgi:putative ABC transport system ATP-binding protein